MCVLTPLIVIKQNKFRLPLFHSVNLCHVCLSSYNISDCKTCLRLIFIHVILWWENCLELGISNIYGTIKVGISRLSVANKCILNCDNPGNKRASALQQIHMCRDHYTLWQWQIRDVYAFTTLDGTIPFTNWKTRTVSNRLAVLRALTIQTIRPKFTKRKHRMCSHLRPKT